MDALNSKDFLQQLTAARKAFWEKMNAKRKSYGAEKPLTQRWCCATCNSASSWSVKRPSRPRMGQQNPRPQSATAMSQYWSTS